MWLVVLVVIATVSGQSRVANSSSYLDAAMTGFDPFYMTALSQPNPGRRTKIFQPDVTLIYSNKTVLYSFVNEEKDTNYHPEITVQKKVNLNQFLDFAASSVYELSSNTECDQPILRYENYSSCTTKNHLRERSMLKFFKDTGGEVLFAKTDIVTHTITISSFVITTFTPAFEKAVETLYKAAVNPVPEIVKSTFNEFVRLYGTHFSRRTLLGSRAIFGKLFSTRVATVQEETSRRQCVLEAVREALTPCMRGCNETTQTVFTRASSERCGGGEHEPIVTINGPLPERILEEWTLAAKNSPNPLFHELEPLSTLFTTEWFEDYFDKKQVRINGTLLSQYFKEHFFDYSRSMRIGGSNSLHFRGCGLNSDCRTGTECRNEPGMESGFSCIPREDAAAATTTTSKTTTIPKTTTPAPTTTASTIPIPTSPAPTTTTTTTTMMPTTTTMMPTTTKMMPTTTTMMPKTRTMKPKTETMRSCQARGRLFMASYSFPDTLKSHHDYGSSNYDNNMSIQCNLLSYDGRVRVTIQSFHTQLNDDYLIIYDGLGRSSPVMGTLSGSPSLTTYTSTSHDMTLLFVTSHETTGRGFYLWFDGVP